MHLKPAPGETLRAALERTVRDAILEGALRAGARLPSSRTLATALGVSRGVTTDAYAQLEAQGFIVVEPQRAPVVADVPRPAHPLRRATAATSVPVRFDFIATSPDVQLFPMRAWLAAFNHAAREAPSQALDYPDLRGHEGLRRALADHLGRTRGVIADPERIVIVQGAAQGIDLLGRVLHAGGARSVAFEDPSLQSQRRRMGASGLRAVAQPMDGHGLIVDGLDADAALVLPAHQFPTGVVLSGERRRALLAWAQARDAIVIEDDYDGEFRYDREPVRALQGLDPERVVYLGTASKVLAPALRIAWLVLPDALVGDAVETKHLLDGGSPVLPQAALARMLENGDHDRHVRRTRQTYRARRDRLAEELSRELPGLRVEGIAAGVHVLLRLAPDADDQGLATRAAAAGIAVEALSQYAVHADAGRGLVLGYGRLHEAAIPRAVRALAKVLTASA